MIAFLLAGCASQPSGHTSQLASSVPGAPAVVLGTFDSRVLAIAYYRSEEFLLAQRERVEHHLAAPTEERQRIEKEMQALQELMHRQGFGTAPIPEIMALIEDKIPAIARHAGVHVLVSKWDLAWQEPETVSEDLSLALAEAFSPDAETRRMLPEILKQKPIRTDQLASDSRGD